MSDDILGSDEMENDIVNMVGPTGEQDAYNYGHTNGTLVDELADEELGPDEMQDDIATMINGTYIFYV